MNKIFKVKERWALICHVSFSCAIFLIYCCRKSWEIYRLTYVTKDCSTLQFCNYFKMAIMSYCCYLVFSVVFRTGMEFAGTSFSILQGCINERGRTIIEREFYQELLFKHPTPSNPQINQLALYYPSTIIAWKSFPFEEGSAI